MRSLLQLPLRHKVTLVTALASTMAVLLAMVMALVHEAARARHDALIEVSREAEIFAGCVGRAVGAREQTRTTELLSLLRMHPDVVAARIVAWGGTFAEFSRPGTPPLPAVPPAQAPIRRFEHGQAFVSQPIISAGQPIGTLLLRAEPPSWLDQLKRRATVFLMAALTALLLALLLAARMQRMIARLFADLTGLVRAVTAQKDYSLRAPRSGDEIGLLTDAFNHMLAQIQRDMRDRKQLERQLLEVSDREQDRLGQDLHDGLCQLLTATALTGSGLKRDLEDRALPEAATAEVIVRRLNDAIATTRQMARGLHPVQLKSQGLAAALTELAAQTRHLFGLDCIADCTQELLIPDQAVATHLYRIAQEAVHNAAKHARPNRIVIQLALQDGRVHLSVTDDGIGLPTPTVPESGMGLATMKYRAEMLGATLQIQPASPRGTVVSCLSPETLA